VSLKRAATMSAMLAAAPSTPVATCFAKGGPHLSGVEQRRAVIDCPSHGADSSD
jgi:hypothetical protein